MNYIIPFLFVLLTLFKQPVHMLWFQISETQMPDSGWGLEPLGLIWLYR